MERVGRKAFTLSTVIAIYTTLLAGCGDSMLAPVTEAPDVPSTYGDETPKTCFTDNIDGSTECPDTKEWCIDEATGQMYECPPFVPVPERYVFADTSALRMEVSSRIDAPTWLLASAEQQQGYQSLRAYLDGGEEFTTGTGEDPTGNEATALQNDGVVRSDFPVGDAILSVLNARGEVQIGQTVYKVTRDNVYAVHVNDLWVLDQKVPTLSSPAPTDGDPRISITPVETTSPPEGTVLTSETPVDGPRLHHVPGVGGTCHVYGGSSNRMRGKSYKTFWFFYTEAGVTTEWERKKKFLWWSYWGNTWQSGTLSYSFTSTLTQGQIGLPGGNPVGPPSGSFSATGTSRIHKTLAWGIFHRIRGEIHSTHSVANSQANGSCNTAG